MKGIIGAICGDIIGSNKEFLKVPIKTKDFELYEHNSTFTDDTIMTLAVANWLCEDRTSDEELIDNLQIFGNDYPDGGYGGRFFFWLAEENPQPYDSWGNGSAMRVSPCAWVAETLEESQELARRSSIVTHNHPEGIKGALAVNDAIFLAKTGSSKEEIKSHVEKTYHYDLSRTVDEIRPSYKFDVSCQGSVPESIISFLDAEDYEDTVRNAVSLGEDTDTQAAIAGSIASAYWEVPEEIYAPALDILDDNLLSVFRYFEEKFM